MFGSKDKPDQPATPQTSQDGSKPEKKGLFGWGRRKNETTEAEAPPPVTPQNSEEAAREAAQSLFSGMCVYVCA